jgi:hypothetical protein
MLRNSRPQTDILWKNRIGVKPDLVEPASS